MRKAQTVVSQVAFAFAAAVLAVAEMPTAAVGLTDSNATDKTATATPSPLMIPFRAPSVQGLPAKRVIYVFAVGGSDDSARGKFVASLASQFTRDPLLGVAIIVAEPSWGLQEFATQCQRDYANTAGALVGVVTEVGSGTRDRFFYKKLWADFSGTAMYAACEDPPSLKLAPTPMARTSLKAADEHTGAPVFIWASDIAYEEDGRNVLNPVAALATLFGLSSAYATFVPSKTHTTLSVQTFPSSVPGATTSIQTTNSSVTNASAVNSITSGLVAQEAVSVGASPGPADNTATWWAIGDVVDDIEWDMNCSGPYASPTPVPSPSAAAPRPSAPICGVVKPTY